MKRTIRQNAALHLWFREVAKAMQDCGITDIRSIRIELPPTEGAIKEIYHGAMKAYCPGVESTADLSTVDLQDLCQIVDQAIAESSGIHVSFPSIETLMRHYEDQHKDS